MTTPQPPKGRMTPEERIELEKKQLKYAHYNKRKRLEKNTYHIGKQAWKTGTDSFKKLQSVTLSYNFYNT